MVPLGLGQAVIGGYNWANLNLSSNIYHITCKNHICDINTLRKQLHILREDFLAIPIPDDISGCISESKLSSWIRYTLMDIYHHIADF